ncbi:MAG: serine/threonine protein kinase [Candidatus Eremiobacteraeota bacterium]|nr:serine/threonine protein kinase [Candidatus Eremiobacteraeota bacterium]
MKPKGVETGDFVGNFEIMGNLGKGAMGSVYRARDKHLHRSVALKVLSSELFQDPAFVERFLREARSIAQLEHPNVVRLYEFGLHEGFHFMAMELLEGGSLGDQLNAGKIFEQNAALQLGIGAAAGLGAAHAAGIIHRDVKPDNLMLCNKSQVKIVDLGIARREKEDSSLTQAGAYLGTPDYVAPEQIQGSDISGQVDIYSLGITLFHMVTGKTPYGGGSLRACIMGHLQKPLPDPRENNAELSDGFVELLKKMTAKEKTERYADMEAVVRAMQALLQPESVAPAPVVEAPAPLVNLRKTGSHAKIPPAPAVVEQAAGHTPEQLQQLESQLVRYIGPLAKILVKRNAAQIGDFEGLAQRLAEQISDPNHRQTFLKAVQPQVSTKKPQ